MKVFVLGAGASKGSQSPGISSSLEAPLSNELFDLKYKKYADQIGVEFEEIEGFRNDIADSKRSLEDWLTNYWEKTEKHSNKGAKRANNQSLGKIHFFIWWMLQSISYETYGRSIGYRNFAKKLRSLNDAGQDFSVISFNYDTLLDMAFEDVLGSRLTGSIESYHDVGLIKPHGSVNWFLPLRSGDSIIHHERSMDAYHRYSVASSSIYNGSNFSVDKAIIFPPQTPRSSNFKFYSFTCIQWPVLLPLAFPPIDVKTIFIC